MNRTKILSDLNKKKVRKPIDKKVYIIISAVLGVLLLGLYCLISYIKDLL